MTHSTLAALLAVVLSSCAANPDPISTPDVPTPATDDPLANGSNSQPDAANRLQPDHAPTPFSADQIREACPSGRVSVFRVETPATPTFRQAFRFNHADAEGVTFVVEQQDESGEALGKTEGQRVLWTRLQSHASYPEADTQITREFIQTAAGPFDCWLYTVTREGKDGTTVQQNWFARELPGPPVRIALTIAGQPQMTMELVTHSVHDTE